MTIEIVDLPIKNGDFPVRYVSSPEGNGNVLMQTSEAQEVTRILIASPPGEADSSKRWMATRHLAEKAVFPRVKNWWWKIGGYLTPKYGIPSGNLT